MNGKTENLLLELIEASDAVILYDITGFSPDAYSKLRNELTACGLIGGSMAAAVLGINPYMSKMKAWLMLSGMHSFEDENEAMWCGRHLEPVVKAMFEERCGSFVSDAPYILKSKKYPWMITTLDGIIMSDDGPGVFEAKTTSFFQSKNWQEGGVADAAHTQALHNMAVTGFDYAAVACLIGGQKFVHKTVERDQALIDVIIQAEQTFYQSVKDKNPPAWEGEDIDLLGHIYPEAINAVVELPSEARNFASQYVEAKSEISRWQRVVKDCEAKLKGMMAENERAICEGFQLGWKTVERKGYTLDPTSFRQFRVKETKGE